MGTSTATPSLAIPGQLLGPASKYRPGPGTHLHESNLYSSLLGTVHVSQPARAPGPVKRLTKITPAPAPAELPTISVVTAAAAPGSAAAKKKREVLPEVGNIVLCRVVRITPRQAVVTILVCGDTVLEAEWQGLIRVQDVRATEKDRVKIYESFRPGDIVRAEVVCSPHPPTRLECSYSYRPACGDTDWDFLRSGRSRWATRPTTTSRRRATSWGLFWLRVRPGISCIPSTGRSTGTRRRAWWSSGRLRSPTEPAV